MTAVPAEAIQAAAAAIHADRCRHPFTHVCTGPSELDREHAKACLQAAAPHIAADVWEQCRQLAITYHAGTVDLDGGQWVPFASRIPAP